MTEFSSVPEKTLLDGKETVLGATDTALDTAQRYSVESMGRAINRFDGWINVRDYITGEPNATTDYSAEFQQAQNDAYAAGVGVFIPRGNYGIASTVWLKASMSGPYGGNMFGGLTDETVNNSGSVIHALMTDSSYCFQLRGEGWEGHPENNFPPDDGDFCHGLYFGNYVIFSNETSGSSARDNKKRGMNFGRMATDVSSGHANRFKMENISFYGLEQGFTHTGWINDFDNLWFTRCALGMEFYWVNDCRFGSIASENCYQTIFWRRSSGSTILKYSDEGSIAGTSSVFTECNGLNIGTLRTEPIDASSPREDGEPLATFDQCTGLNIEGLNVKGMSRGLSYDSPAIAITGSDGVELQGTVTGYDDRWPDIIRWDNASTNAANVHVRESGTGSTIINTSAAYGLYPMTGAYNVFPNGDCSGLRFPFPVAGVNATISEEGTYRFRENKSIRVTPVAGTHAGGVGVRFRVTNQDVRNQMSQQMTVAVWVYVPENEAFRDRTLLPYLTVGSTINPDTYSDVADGPNTRTGTGTCRTGGWSLQMLNYLNWSINTQTTDSSDIVFYIDKQGVHNFGQGGDEYVIIGKVAVVRGWCHGKVANGHVIDNGFSATTYHNRHNVEYHLPQSEAADAIALSDNNWRVGDRFTYLDPAASSSPGIVCTTAGIGASAKWSPMMALGAEN